METAMMSSKVPPLTDEEFIDVCTALTSHLKLAERAEKTESDSNIRELRHRNTQRFRNLLHKFRNQGV